MSVQVNYLAVLVCAVASMVIGYVWYGPLFGKAWMKSIGMDPGSMNDPARRKEMMSQAGPGYAAMFIGSLVTAYIFTKVLGHFGVVAIDMNAIKVTVGIWLGFIALCPSLGGKFFGKQSWTYYFVTVGYSLVALAVYAVILISWK